MELDTWSFDIVQVTNIMQLVHESGSHFQLCIVFPEMFDILILIFLKRGVFYFLLHLIRIFKFEAHSVLYTKNIITVQPRISVKMTLIQDSKKKEPICILNECSIRM